MGGRGEPREALKGQFDFLLDAVGFDQDLDDLLIIQHIVKRQRPALAVLQPFLRWLIPANVEFPCNGRDVFEILVRVDVDAPPPYRLTPHRVSRHAACHAFLL